MNDFSDMVDEALREWDQGQITKETEIPPHLKPISAGQYCYFHGPGPRYQAVARTKWGHPICATCQTFGIPGSK